MNQGLPFVALEEHPERVGHFRNGLFSGRGIVVLLIGLSSAALLGWQHFAVHEDSITMDAMAEHFQAQIAATRSKPSTALGRLNIKAYEQLVRENEINAAEEARLRSEQSANAREWELHDEASMKDHQEEDYKKWEAEQEAYLEADQEELGKEMEARLMARLEAEQAERAKELEARIQERLEAEQAERGKELEARIQARLEAEQVERGKRLELRLGARLQAEQGGRVFGFGCATRTKANLTCVTPEVAAPEPLAEKLSGISGTCNQDCREECVESAPASVAYCRSSCASYCADVSCSYSKDMNDELRDYFEQAPCKDGKECNTCKQCTVDTLDPKEVAKLLGIPQNTEADERTKLMQALKAQASTPMILPLRTGGASL